MRTVVCVKHVPDSTIVKFDIRTRSLDNLFYILDPVDEVGVSEAIKIRERNGGDVTAITLGPTRAEAVLRTCLKMGVDRAVHLCHEAFDVADAHLTAEILAKYIHGLGCDLVLCGNQSMDQGSGYVGAGIAAHLRLPLVTSVTRIDVFADTASAVVHRRLRGGDREIVETPLPAVLTVDTVLTSPVYPRLRTILAGVNKQIERVDPKTLGVNVDALERALELVSISQPKPRLKKTATIDSSMSAQERMHFLMKGGMQQKSSNVVQKQPDAAAADIIQFLLDNGIICRPQ
jgi:electron transfer flavoprotein beta subunit